MIVSLIALFVASTGKAVAVNNRLISGSQIVDHSIPASKLTPAALTLPRGRIGPQGPPGPQGAAGGFDPSKVQIIEGTPLAAVGPTSVVLATAACPPNTIEVGGGGYSSTAKMILSGPSQNGAPGWTIGVFNDTGITISNEIRAYVECASP
jgi:hypothetical protein